MTLAEAVKAHDAAQERASDAHFAFKAAEAHALAVRQQVTSGDSDVTPADLANADDAVEHARLAQVGAEVAVGPLQAAVRAAEADASADAVAGALPTYGDAVVQALDTLLADLTAFAARVREYDDFVAQVTPQLDSVAQVSPRVRFPRFGVPTVDGLPLTSCRGASHLAAVLIPAMRAIGAPTFALNELKTLAQGASSIPTT